MCLQEILLHSGFEIVRDFTIQISVKIIFANKEMIIVGIYIGHSVRPPNHKNSILYHSSFQLCSKKILKKIKKKKNVFLCFYLQFLKNITKIIRIALIPSCHNGDIIYIYKHKYLLIPIEQYNNSSFLKNIIIVS